MELTILGSGSPIPDPTRAGTSLVIETGSKTVLVDCGPGAVEGLMEAGINPKAIDSVIFTHHHMDHNASFFHFVISSWMLGRQSLSVYGPDGTENLIEALHLIYESDFEYRESLGRSLDGVNEIQTGRVDDSFSLQIGNCSVSALPVDHSIETFALRFDDEQTGESFVFTSDTAPVDGLSEFAAGADVLLHDCSVGPMLESPPEDKPTWEKFFDPDQAYIDRLREVHCTPEECGQTAAEADVEKLVLTHLTPYLDPDGLKRNAGCEFDGPIVVAEDGMHLTPRTATAESTR